MFDTIGKDIANGFANVFLGWVPQWLWDVIEWWPWIIGAVGVIVAVGTLYRIYRVGGWPALVAAVGALGVAVGYVLGSRTKDTPEPIKPEPVSKGVTKARIKIKSKHRKTIFDNWTSDD